MEPVFSTATLALPRVKEVLAKVDWPTLFDESGVQYMLLNTSIQLGSENWTLARARTVLTVADAFNYLLSGVEKIECPWPAPPSFTTALGQVGERLIGALDFPARFPRGGPVGDRLARSSRRWRRKRLAKSTWWLHFRDRLCRGGVSHRERPGVHQFRHMVVMGLELSSQSLPCLSRVEFYQRDWLRRHSFAQEHHGGWCRNVDAPGRPGATNTAMLTWPLAASAEPHRSVKSVRPAFAPDNMPQRIAETCRETGQGSPGQSPLRSRKSRIALCAHATGGGKTRRLASGKTAHRRRRQPQRAAQSTHRRRGQ